MINFYQIVWFTALGVLSVASYGGYRRWWRRSTKAEQRDMERPAPERTLQLHGSEERFREILNTVVDGIITIDARGRIEMLNPAVEKMFGYRAEELLGQDLNVLMPVPVADAHDDFLINYSKTGNKKTIDHCREVTGKRKDGSTFPMELRISEAHRNGRRCFTGVMRDITVRKQAEEEIRAALQDSENKDHVLFDEAPTPLWEIDMSGAKSLLEQWRKNGADNLRAFLDEHSEAVEQCLDQVITRDVNRAACRLYQAKSKEQLFANLRQIWLAESIRAFKKQLVAIAEGNTDNELETSMQTLQGKKINIWTQWHVVPGYEQSWSRIFIATIDMTERKKALKELKASRERLRALSAHLQSLREEERLTIARDLHDELGQALTSLKMDLSMLERKVQSANGRFDCATVLGDITSMQKLLAGTITQVRSLISELRPEVLDKLGLVSALEWQLEEFYKRTGMPFEFNSTVEDLNLPSTHAVAVFRIFQESITNIVRHSSASRVRVKIEKRQAILSVEISDNGRGIRQEELNAPGKFGLLGMRERAWVFGGEVSFTGVAGRGTTVHIKAPLPGA